MSYSYNKFNTVVVGGGPAGIMSAIFASQKGKRVAIIEKNPEVGVKLLMTGKGRCNITNAENDVRKFIEMFGRNGKFLFSAFSEFNNRDIVDFFEERGLSVKVERGNRIFPESDRSDDVRKALLLELKKRGVEIINNTKVSSFNFKENKISSVSVNSGGKTYEIFSDSFILATGGKSYPASGSSGDGYAWAQQMGHKIVKPIPSLTPVIVEEGWVSELEGLSLKNVKISLFQSNKKVDERFGEAIFTSNGMSGPIILDMSKNVSKLLESGNVEMRLDFKPALSFEQLDKRIQKDFSDNINKNFGNSLDELLPKKMIPVLIELSKIDCDKKVNLVSRDERKKVVHLLKEFTLTVSGVLGFNKAIITSGGVDLHDIDPKTMKSKIIDNLFFAGEVLDLDAPTGGYNLQECWSTGCLAGKSSSNIL